MKLEFQPSTAARRLTRIGMLGAAWLVVSGMFASSQLGCLTPDRYECGNKASLSACFVYPHQADCQTRPNCEWRVGCASGCQHSTTNAECGEQHLACGVITSPPACFSGRCDGQTEKECGMREDCFWEPSCFDSPDVLPCKYDLSEDECKRRDCEWVKQDRDSPL